MRVAISCDHAGFLLKDEIISAVRAAGHDVLDLGTNSTEAVDYPDFTRKACQAVLYGEAERAIVICGSGVGASIAANKFKGIYAGLCHDTYSAHQGVEHDNMNVLCLGSRIIGAELAKEIVRAFLSASFSGEERHVRRFGKVQSIERQN